LLRQIQVGYILEAADDAELRQTIHNTINPSRRRSLAKPAEPPEANP
jgi:hypothetical protein